MQFTFEIDVDLNDDEAEQLARIMECDQEELGEALQPVAAAGLEEHLRMFLGQKVFTRGSDMREYRLFLLIKYLFEENIPDEEEVCALFQTTETQSRSLIRSVVSKYQYELQSALERSMKKIVENATQYEEGSDYEVVIHTGSLRDGLNRLLASRDGSLPQVSKKRGTVSTYEIKPSAYQTLCDELDVTIGPDEDG